MEHKLLRYDTPSSRDLLDWNRVFLLLLFFSVYPIKKLFFVLYPPPPPVIYV